MREKVGVAVLYKSSKPFIRAILFIIIMGFVFTDIVACDNPALSTAVSAPTATQAAGLDFVDDGNKTIDFIQDFSNMGGYQGDKVPDAQMAYRVAMVYLYQNIDVKAVDSQKPYHVSFEAARGVWLIQGTDTKDLNDGGPMDVVIQKTDGKVLGIAVEAN